MFVFVIRYFGFLKFVPLLPHLVDAWLRFWEIATGSPVPECVDDIEAEVLSWPGTYKSIHKYGGLQLNCQGRELGHIHSNGLVDMLLSRKIKEELLKAGRITGHHSFKNSGWISFYIRNRQDAEYAQELLKMAWLKINKVD